MVDFRLRGRRSCAPEEIRPSSQFAARKVCLSGDKFG
jgi:hypothetical protein